MNTVLQQRARYLNYEVNHLILVGPMGAGKSTIGRLLAKALNRSFKDSDQEIEQRSGVDIPWIFEKEGEQGFRARETAMLAELCQQDNLVLATGGGAILSAENRALLQSSGFVIYLCIPVAEQLKRTAQNRSRPLLNQGNPEQVLEQLMSVRDPLYRQVANLTIETDGNAPQQTTQEILNYLGQTAPSLFN